MCLLPGPDAEHRLEVRLPCAKLKCRPRSGLLCACISAVAPERHGLTNLRAQTTDGSHLAEASTTLSPKPNPVGASVAKMNGENFLRKGIDHQGVSATLANSSSMTVAGTMALSRCGSSRMSS